MPTMSLQDLVKVLQDMVHTVTSAGLATEDVDIKVFGERGDPSRVVATGNIGMTTVTFTKTLN